jgi:hypothetical protein
MYNLISLVEPGNKVNQGVIFKRGDLGSRTGNSSIASEALDCLFLESQSETGIFKSPCTAGDSGVKDSDAGKKSSCITHTPIPFCPFPFQP